MSVKLILLKSGENIISNVKEGFLEETLVCYILENPCNILFNGTYEVSNDDSISGNSKNKVSISLNPWPYLSNQTTVELVPDWILTIVDPNDELKKLYETQVLGIVKNENDQTDAFSEQSDFNESD